MSRFGSYLDTMKLAKIAILSSKQAESRKDYIRAIHYQTMGIEYLIVAMNNLSSIAFNKKPKRGSTMKALIVTVLVAMGIGQALAFDRSQNPDRYMSVGLDVSSGKLAGMLKTVPAGEPATDGGFVKGLLDLRVPVSNALTVHAFGSATGVNNNLQYSEGSEVGLGFRVYIH